MDGEIFQEHPATGSTASRCTHANNLYLCSVCHRLVLPDHMVRDFLSKKSSEAESYHRACCLLKLCLNIR